LLHKCGKAVARRTRLSSSGGRRVWSINALYELNAKALAQVRIAHPLRFDGARRDPMFCCVELPALGTANRFGDKPRSVAQELSVMKRRITMAVVQPL
jgi:hypothetical protein